MRFASADEFFMMLASLDIVWDEKDAASPMLGTLKILSHMILTKST